MLWACIYILGMMVAAALFRWANVPPPAVYVLFWPALFARIMNELPRRVRPELVRLWRELF